MTSISKGKCEEALELTTEEVKFQTEQLIETECRTFEMEIISIDCNTEGKSSICCYKDRRSSIEMEFGFELIMKEDQWKVAYALKPWPCMNESESVVTNDSINTSETKWNIGIQFINEYRNFVDTNTRVNRKIEWLSNSNFVSTNFLNDLQQMSDEGQKKDPFIGLDYDPIFIAQDYPDEGFKLKSIDSTTNSMVVQGIDWNNFEVEIWLIENNGNWIVDGAGEVNARVKN